MQQNLLSAVLNADSFGQAYLKDLATTVRVLRSRGLSQDRAQEVAQAAWTRAWEHRAQLHEPDRLLNWINSIAFNLYITERRHPFLQFNLEMPGSSPTVLDAIQVEELLALCSQAERHLLTLHYVEGWSMKEIATKLGGRKPAAVRLAVFRAKSRLQKLQLTHRGFNAMDPRQCLDRQKER